MIVLGIDPGVTGALALVRLTHDQAPELLEVHDLPTRAIKMTKRTALRLDVRKTHELLETVIEKCTDANGPTNGQAIDRIVVERLTGGPGINSTTAFSLGWTGAVLDSVLTLLGRGDYIHASPSAWKRTLLVPADKAQAKKRATKLFGHDKGWPREKDHNRAEAALLALYGAVRK
ncbi:holliday junction resolvase [Sinorhizobium phage phiM5]|nr:holliday junction resolvase [Sinorhizobium phage phiM5]